MWSVIILTIIWWILGNRRFWAVLAAFYAASWPTAYNISLINWSGVLSFFDNLLSMGRGDTQSFWQLVLLGLTILGMIYLSHYTIFIYHKLPERRPAHAKKIKIWFRKTVEWLIYVYIGFLIFYLLIPIKAAEVIAWIRDMMLTLAIVWAVVYANVLSWAYTFKDTVPKSAGGTYDAL